MYAEVRSRSRENAVKKFLSVGLSVLALGCESAAPATWDDFANVEAEVVASSGLTCVITPTPADAAIDARRTERARGDVASEPCGHAAALGACLGEVLLTSVEHEAVLLEVPRTTADRGRDLAPLRAVSKNAASLTAPEIRVEWEGGQHRLDLRSTSGATYAGRITIDHDHAFTVRCGPR
jgi:hypothetical protein